MNCKCCQARLNAYIDNELARAEAMEVRAHLFDCDACASEHQDLRNLKSILSRSSVPEPDAFFEERLVASVMRQIPTESPRKRWAGALVFAGVAACSMAATLAIIQSMNQNRVPSAAENDSNIAFEVRRDMMYQAGSDPMGGIPVLSAANEPPK